MNQVDAAADREPVLVTIALAPLRAVERTRGLVRLGVLAVYGMIALAASAVLWRQAQLRGLPDVGAPFDVAAFRASAGSPGGREALAAYRRAAERYVEMGPAESESYSNANPSWPKADASFRARVERNDEAIALLSEGSTCDTPALGWSAGASVRMAVSENAQLGVKVFRIARAALLKAGRLRAEGDPAGAWALLNAAVRAGRHVEWIEPTIHGRTVGMNLAQYAHAAVAEWAEDPAVGVALLRQALDDLIAAEALTPPLSVTYKAEYLITMESPENEAALNPRSVHPDPAVESWDSFALHLRPGLDAYLAGEPERSRRVLNLLVANDLAWCDRSSAQRPGFAVPDLRIYEPDPTAPISARGLDPEALAAWAGSSRHAGPMRWRQGVIESFDRSDRWRMWELSEAVASALFFKETGRRPASPAEALRRYRPEPGDAPDRDEAEPLP